MSESFLIVGLGNPGSKYTETRHNAGFWFLGELLRELNATVKPQTKLHSELVRLEALGRTCILAMPTTFMNHSGQAVRAVMDYYQIYSSNLLVAYDELDLSPGTVRLKQGGGHGGHNGMRDIFRHVPEHDFLRLRIGIGHPGVKDRVTDYVLSRPPSGEELEIRRSIGSAIAVLPEVLGDQLANAMKKLHTNSPQTAEK
ncbi:MAG: aminoacyl-tRNA hydrolase [Xanthomonadales bacterium]|nr:aminoacyl-tRNA hydrolase [Xanthomonadales bacterium]